MSDPGKVSSFQSNLLRGEMLRNQKRYAEAETYLQQAIAEEPSNAQGYYELAFCYCNWDGHSQKALSAIDRALSLDPNRSEYFSLRAWILGNVEKHKEVFEVADHALALNSYNLLALNAKTRAYGALFQWDKAEANARQTLAIYSRNELAANLLAQALRQQGRLQESEAVTVALLSQAPDSAMAQCNAGWSALQVGDHRRANRHFLEALRLDPHYDYARRGLLHSFNSRVWLYRPYFQLIAWLGKYGTGMRYFVAIVVYLIYRFIVTEVQSAYGNDSDRAFYWVLVVMVCYFIFFGFGRSFGNLFLFLDPFARYALTSKEKRWSVFVGLFYAFVLGVEVMGSAWPQVAILVTILAIFLWGVLFPRFENAWAGRSSSEETMN